MNDDNIIRKILESSKTIALVGASPRPHRASHQVMGYLMAKGYRVIPVNPTEAGASILGQSVRASLSEIDEPIDMVDIFRNSVDAGDAVDAAIAAHAKSIWMQLGVINEPAAERAQAAGLDVVMDRCPALEIPRLNL
ncbi:CoA-binding protein [Marinobacterium rhizophilum]|uniref:CoA-binding protein n=1 Tax=Marinobacterium rhizophilum TaxID=420402 RepID=A0ABY5HGW3_9GAMM|nr:CoA-binding protein [Marinobacterium rhizophilum]UTW11483.1 CoA-binding protein [Marinobacterium rhizophilum]